MIVLKFLICSLIIRVKFTAEKQAYIALNVGIASLKKIRISFTLSMGSNAGLKFGRGAREILTISAKDF